MKKKGYFTGILLSLCISIILLGNSRQAEVVEASSTRIGFIIGEEYLNSGTRWTATSTAGSYSNVPHPSSLVGTDLKQPAGYSYNNWIVYWTNSSGTVLGNTGYAAVGEPMSDVVTRWSASDAKPSGAYRLIFKCDREAHRYYVAYDANGGSGSMSKSTCLYGYSYALKENTFTKTNYTFNGWNTSADGSGKSYSNKASINSLTTEDEATITLYAQWKGNSHKVTFNANGGTDGSTTSKSVNYGSTYGELSTPTRTGYTFNGWYTAVSGGTKITSSSTVSITSDQTLYAHWTANTYKVTFDANGGTDGSTTSKNVTYDSTYGELPTPTRTGYTFNGWYTAVSGGSKITSGSKVSTASDQTLYARWTANTYKVTFDANGGTDGSTTSKNVTYDSTYGELPTPTRTGYTFNGWYTAVSGGTKITSGSTVSTTSDQRLYARWTANTYTVTFHANGGTDGSTTSKSVTYDSTYGDLPTPTRTGYTFNGWYTATSGGTKITSDSTVSITSDQVLYAQWTINSYDVNYNANGGTTDAETVKVNYNSPIDLSPVAVKEGYTFVGWGTSEDAGIPLGSLTMGTENVTLYALYTIEVSDVANHTHPDYDKVKDEEVYLLIVRADDGMSQTYPLEYTVDAARMTYQYVLHGTDISSFVGDREYCYYVIAHDNAGNYSIITEGESDGGTPPAPDIREEYLQTVNHYRYIKYLESWVYFDVTSEKVTKGETYTPAHITPPEGYENGDIDESYTVTADKISGAYYNPKTYTLTFDARGGSCDTDSKEIIYSDYYGFLPVPVKKGHTFQGWNTEPDGSGMTVRSSDIYNTAGDSTVYAQWTADVYTIILDNQNATMAGTVLYYEKYGVGNYTDYFCFTAISKITLPTRTGCTFMGYYTGKGGTGTCYVDSDGKILSTGTTFESDTTLYACWEVNTYSIRYDANGGEGIMEDTDAVYDKYVTLSTNTFTKKGHTFAGWSLYPDGFVWYKDRDSVINLSTTDKDTITLYAVWTVNSYNVTYDYRTNGGTWAFVDTTTVAYGGNIDLTVTAWKDGYTFVGWNTDPNATTELTSLSMADENVTLYAVFKKDIAVTIIEQTDDGTVTRELKTTVYNNTSSADFAMEQENIWSGWKMLGWTNETGADVLPNVGIGTCYRISDSITLYALYAKEVTVSYDTNGSAADIASQTKECFYNASDNYKNPVFRIADAPVLSGHSFVEWVDADGNPYTAGSETTFEKDAHLTAEWDRYPEIEAYDRYFTLEEAQNGEITEAVLLEKVTGTDQEDGILENGADVVVKNYVSSVFTGIHEDEEIEVTYRAEDSFGNTVEKSITIHVVDTAVRESRRRSYPRFISLEFYSDGENPVSEEEGGLKTTSLWRTEESYKRLLESVLFNSKTNEEYKTIEYFGLGKEIKVAGSGTWERIEETWTFTKADLEAVEGFTLEHGLGNLRESDAVEQFLELFGVCVK